MSRPSILLWYRTDLRVADHEPLHQAVRTNAFSIFPVYCVDPRQFGQTSFGFPKTGAFRSQFLLESLADLRRSLRQLGSDLIIRYGYPETIIPDLAQQLNISAVYYHAEVTSEEVLVEEALERALKPIGVELQSFWGHTLYHPEDLPFDMGELPELPDHVKEIVDRI